MRLLIAEDELDLAEALTVFFEKNQFLYVNYKEYFITLRRIIDWFDVPHLIHNQSTDYMVFNDLVENLNL